MQGIVIRTGAHARLNRLLPSCLEFNSNTKYETVQSKSNINTSTLGCTRYMGSNTSSKKQNNQAKHKLKIKSHKDSKYKQKEEDSKDSVYTIQQPPESSTDTDDEHEHHLAQLKKEKIGENRGLHATKVGAVANVCLAISKGTLGFMVNSTGLIADAANSAGDLLCDAVVYYTVQEARKSATPDRPWGRGKFESIGALSVGGLLLCTGTGIGYSALTAAVEFSNLAEIHGISASLISDLDSIGVGNTIEIVGNEIDQEEASTAAKFAALGVSAMSIFVKEMLFKYTLKAGEASRSAAVIANAWQHRSDAAVSTAVFAGLAGSMVGYPLLDPLAAFLVAGVIVHQGIVIGMEALKDLSDLPASAAETEELKATCYGVKGIVAVEQIHARTSGPYLFVEVTVGVLGTISASAAHRIGEMTRLELLKKHSGRVANAVVDVNPLGSTGLGEQSPSWARDHDFIVEEVTKLLCRNVTEIVSVTEVQVYYLDNGRIAVKVDIVLPAHHTIAEAHKIAAKAKNIVESELGLSDVDIDLELEEDETP